MKSAEKPPTGLQKQALKKLLKMEPQKRDKLLKIEALRRGVKAPKMKG